jgi:hypothetical protein
MGLMNWLQKKDRENQRTIEYLADTQTERERNRVGGIWWEHERRAEWERKNPEKSGSDNRPLLDVPGDGSSRGHRFDSGVTSDRVSFERVFLDVPPDADAFATAATSLRSVTPEQFTQAAAAALETRGIEPAERSLVVGPRRWLRRAARSSRLGWKFEIYLPGPSAFSLDELWLLTDRNWASASGPQAGHASWTSPFRTIEFTPEMKRQLIDGRTLRVADWQDRKSGELHAGVQGVESA